MAMKGNLGSASQAMVLTPEQFLHSTRMKSTKVLSAVAITEGGQTRVKLPQAGLGHRLWISIQGTLVCSGTMTAAFWNPYTATTDAKSMIPAPWGLIKRLRLASNTAFSLRDLSGWSLAKWCRARHGKEFESIVNSNIMTGGLGGVSTAGAAYSAGMFGAGSAFAAANARIVPGGTVTDATTYPVNILIPLDISYNNAGETGLLVLQQDSVFYELIIDWGTLTNTTTSGTTHAALNDAASGTGTSVIMTLTSPTVTVGLDWFEVVPGIDNLISAFMSVSDMMNPGGLIVGENVIRPPSNDLYTMFLVEAMANGLPVPMTTLSNLTFMHSGNVRDFDEDLLTNMARWYWQHGVLPTTGSFGWDFGLRRGELERRDTLDGFNYQNVTDLALKFTNSTALGSQNQVSVVMESLRRIQQI